MRPLRLKRSPMGLGSLFLKRSMTMNSMLRPTLDLAIDTLEPKRWPGITQEFGLPFRALQPRAELVEARLELAAALRQAQGEVVIASPNGMTQVEGAFGSISSMRLPKGSSTKTRV